MAALLNEQSIAALVDEFYTHIREDDLLGPVFDGVIGNHWPEHLAKMKDFWNSVMLSAGTYKGNPMMAHLPIPEMDQEHLVRWLTLWQEATFRIFEPEVAEIFFGKAILVGDRFVEAATRVREAQLAAR